MKIGDSDTQSATMLLSDLLASNPLIYHVMIDAVGAI